MVQILLVTPERGSLSEFGSALAEHGDVAILWARSGHEALDLISETDVDLVVTDEGVGDMTGLELIRRLIRVRPMIHCAPVSALSSHDFHEASEGLGVLAQVSVRPGRGQAKDLLARLRKIKDLEAGRPGIGGED
jgi:DNA-binding NarL/FixJ family response regulator